jgi:hypothetical protein
MVSLRFTTSATTLKKVFENREQIEISKHYERLPKPSLIAAQEYLRREDLFKESCKGSISQIIANESIPRVDFFFV